MKTSSFFFCPKVKSVELWSLFGTTWNGSKVCEMLWEDNCLDESSMTVQEHLAL